MDTTQFHGKRLAHASAPGDVVSLARVHKVYGSGLSGVHALHDIDLQVGSGEMVAVCGPGGSGKTTLLQIAGMLDTATEGNVVVASLLVARLSEQARADLRAEMIGFVFQFPNLLPFLTARENVLLPLMLRGCIRHGGHGAAHERADALLAQLGLATQARYDAARLDPGQCQRVAIARALITRPRLVVADEPVSRLDGGSLRLVMDLFARQQREHGTAFLISTGDQRQLAGANRCLQLRDGRLDGPDGVDAGRALRVRP